MTTGTKRRASDEGAEPPPPPPAHRPLKYGIGCDRNGQDLLYFCGQGCLEISFMRTLRVSDNEETSELPPGFGRFPLHHVKDYAENFSSEEGFFLPMYQREAMWIRFKSSRAFTVKIFVGGVNAVSGELQHEDQACQHRLLEKYKKGQCIQDYVVSLHQPWLDGIADENGTVRQFVAMPLGSGYSVEAQITGEEAKGGIQIQVTPQHRPSTLWGMNATTLSQVYVKTLTGKQHPIRTPLDTGTIDDLMFLVEDKTDVTPNNQRLIYNGNQLMLGRKLSDYNIQPESVLHLVYRLRGGGGGELTLRDQEKMGIAAGGRIKQSIVRDTTAPTFWDGARTTTVDMHIVNSTAFKQITGMDPPETPITAKTYEKAGLPYFDIWNEKPSGIKGDFEGVKSVNQLNKESEQNGATKAAIQEVENSTSHPVVKLDRHGKRLGFRHVKDLEEELEEMLKITDT